MGSVLAPGFLEFGMSGRRYDRDAIIMAESHPIGARLPLEDFTVTFLRPDFAPVTYVSQDEADGPRRANRMSPWERGGGRWQLRFHQATALPPGEPSPESGRLPHVRVPRTRNEEGSGGGQTA